jgi:hypothetical protein
VGFVKSSFFKVGRFHDAENLEQQRRDWQREVNEQRPCHATGIIPALRLAEEAPRLRALKVQPEELALRIPVYVGPTGTVVHVRNWSYEVLEREVRANVVYRRFCRIGTEMDRGHASDCIRPSSRSGASAPESFANDLRYVRRM